MHITKSCPGKIHSKVKTGEKKKKKSQDRRKNFNATKYKNCTDMVSDSTLKLTFEKLYFIWFQCIIKQLQLQLSEKAIKIAFSNYTTYQLRLNFNTLQIYHNRLNVKEDMRIHLSCYLIKLLKQS